MEKFENIKSILNEEIRLINGVENIEKLLEINKTYEVELEKIKESLDEYVVNLKSNEKYFDEFIKLINELCFLIGKKCSQFNEVNSKSVNEKVGNSEEFHEQLELQKSQFKVKYLENNNYFKEMMSSLKIINEKIIEIEQYYSDAVAEEKICQENLLVKERKIEELARKKEQEEAAKRELEQKELQRAKEAAKAAELKQKEVERMKKIMEEEEEARNSEVKIEHFTKMRYDLVNSEFGDTGLGCYVKYLPGFMTAKSDISVELIDPLNINCNFDGTDEIVSNIIKISSPHMENEDSKFEQAFTVILPHTMSRTPARETKIAKFLQDEMRWVSVDTKDVTMEDSDKSGARFVESIFDELPLTLTVVSIPRIEELQYNKKGCNWTAAVDSRVNFLIPQGAVKINRTVNITTLAFDSSLTQDIKAKSKGTNADNVYTLTPLLKIEELESRKLLKPITISLPLPQKQLSKAESGNMPMTVFGSSSESRPKTNFGTPGAEEKVCLLNMDVSKKWSVNTTIGVEIDEKKDSIKFEVEKLSDMVFVAVRARAEASSEQIGKGVEIIMDHFKLRQIKIVVAHHCEDPNFLIVTVCPSSRLDKQLRTVKEDGFDDKNSHISHEIEIKEREILTFRFRGNLKVENETEDYVQKMMYSTQLKNKTKIKLEVVDQYAQRAKTKYEGFLTVTTSKWIKKPQPRVEGQTRKGPPQMIDVEEIIPIFETLLDIPKVQHLTSSKIINRDYHFVSKDSITEGYIRELSNKIQDDWKQLAKALDLPPTRIEEISSAKCDGKQSPKMAYEVLKLWIMHLPVSRNKEKILNKALSRINRLDLAENIVT